MDSAVFFLDVAVKQQCMGVEWEAGRGGPKGAIQIFTDLWSASLWAKCTHHSLALPWEILYCFFEQNSVSSRNIILAQDSLYEYSWDNYSEICAFDGYFPNVLFWFSNNRAWYPNLQGIGGWVFNKHPSSLQALGSPIWGPGLSAAWSLGANEFLLWIPRIHQHFPQSLGSYRKEHCARQPECQRHWYHTPTSLNLFLVI